MVRVKNDEGRREEDYQRRVRHLFEQRLEKIRIKRMTIKPPRPTKAQMIYRRYVSANADTRLSTYLVNYAWEHVEIEPALPIASIFDDLRIEPSPDITDNLPLLML